MSYFKCFGSQRIIYVNLSEEWEIYFVFMWDLFGSFMGAFPATKVRDKDLREILK